MRDLADTEHIRRFMESLGRETQNEVRLYFTGGTTAVLMGWRDTTVDMDIHMVPDDDRIFRAIPKLKETLHINVELACPSDFIPELPGWQDRSRFIDRVGSVSFHHYDFYAQALAKIERGHAQDVQDVDQMLQRKLVEPARLMEHFERIEPLLYRYPAVDPGAFRRAVDETLHG